VHERPHDCGGQHREAADPGENEQAPGLRLFIESRYSTNKLRPVGKIEIMCSASEARLDDPIR
jgi:hypothetical protein